MTYGVTSTGFVIKPLTTIQSEIEQNQLDNINDALDHSAEQPLGQVNGIFSEQLSELWEAAQALYRTFDPDNATAASLDNLAALTGVTRLPATVSTGTILATGTNATLLPSGRVASVSGSGNRFATTAAGTITTATSWAGATAYVVGDIRTNSGNIYYCTIAGTSAGAGGPTGTGTAIVDNTVTWRYVGAGAGYASIAVESEDTGPIVGNAWTIDTIETPVSGWSNVNNAIDATLGTDVETDAELRLRRDEGLEVTGNATMDAIRAGLLAVTDVTDVAMFENITMLTDADLLPAKSFEAVVQGGATADIAQEIWDSKPAGIETYGTSNDTATDAVGASHTVYFTRPSSKTIYIIIEGTKSATDYPSDGDTQIKEALVAHGATLEIGDDVIRSKLFDIIFNVAGVTDITAIKLGFAPAPAAELNLTIAEREISTWNTSYITVTLT